MEYDFTTLSPSEFESLVADLLSREWRGRLESFKEGKDGGIDLRHSDTPKGKSQVIVQCKRYAPHKFAELVTSVKKELVKLKALKPRRYVLVTSVRLSPANKAALLDVLSPWCKGTADILGPSELNGLLRDHPDVERAHFKLWMASTAVLEQILHARIFAVTEATIEATKVQMSRLVIHNGMSPALRILEENHHIVIVGNPGIGKSTLARMLMCEYMKDGYEPVWVTSNIEDAWAVINSASKTGRKLVIVYDDFLGRVQFNSQRLAKNEDHALLQLLDKAAVTSDIRFILTTREYILADAKRIHGAFEARAGELVKCTLSLEHYAKSHRAQMLFNHLYFSDLPNTRLEKLVKTKTYREIVDHRHFNPRVVESISKHANSRALTDTQYIEFVEKEFDNPAKLWAHPFKSELSPMSRQILAVLWSYMGEAELEELMHGVVLMNGTAVSQQNSLQFEDALRMLDGNFVLTNRYPGARDGKLHTIVEFQNPSVEEFMGDWMREHTEWLMDMASVVQTMRQVNCIADCAGEIEKSAPLPPLFWQVFAQRASECESRPQKYFAHLQTSSAKKSFKAWFVDEPDIASETLQLLQVLSRDATTRTKHQDFKRRVLTRDGWATLLQPIVDSNTAAYGVKELQQWIVEESGWPSAETRRSDNALRAAVCKVLDSGEYFDLTSLRLIIEACMLTKRPLKSAELETILSAAQRAAEEVRAYRQGEVEADALTDDAEELELLAAAIDADLSSDVIWLRMKAAEAESNNPKVQEPPSTKREYTDPLTDQPLDIDKLFSGLLDR